MLPGDGYGDVAYIALQVEDEAGFATDDIETALPVAEVSSINCNVTKEKTNAMRHDEPLRSESSAPRRPIYDLRDDREKTDVTVAEQNNIDLISSFTSTYTTENGRAFTKSLMTIVTAEEFRKSFPTDRFIMWPTHPPDDTETLDGDYGSTTNWKFAKILEVDVGGVTRAYTVGTLHPEEGAAPSWKIKLVTFVTPSRFLIPTGRYHRLALKKHTSHQLIVPLIVIAIAFATLFCIYLCTYVICFLISN